MTNDFPLHPIPAPLTWRRGAFEFTGKWAELFRSFPETGMGYTVIGVTLQDGRMFDQVAVGNRGVVHQARGLEDIPFTQDDIIAMIATHKRNSLTT